MRGTSAKITISVKSTQQENERIRQCELFDAHVFTNQHREHATSQRTEENKQQSRTTMSHCYQPPEQRQCMNKRVHEKVWHVDGSRDAVGNGIVPVIAQRHDARAVRDDAYGCHAENNWVTDLLKYT